MKKAWKGVEYSTKQVSDDLAGWTAIELHGTEPHGSSKLLARVVFWDAEGQFSFEMFREELPLIIVESLIQEARSAIDIG